MTDLATISSSEREKQRRQRQRTASLQDRYIGTAEAAAFIGHSEVQFRKLVKYGKVPRPVRIGERKLPWRLSALADFMTRLEFEQGVRAAPNRRAARLGGFPKAGRNHISGGVAGAPRLALGSIAALGSIPKPSTKHRAVTRRTENTSS